MRIPTLLFVNKIDRTGAGHERVVDAMRRRLTPALIPMQAPRRLGTPSVSVSPFGRSDGGFVAALTEVVADHDDALLARFIEGGTTIPYERLRAELSAQTARALVHPVFFGSAITGAGVSEIMAGIAELLPAAEGDAEAPASATVFKVDRGPAGERVAYARLFAGTIQVRDRVPCSGNDPRTITAIEVFDRGPAVRRRAAVAGQIARIWGLGEVRIGDAIGVSPPTGGEYRFAPPTLETVVVPLDAVDARRLHVALTQLAEQDPLIDVRHDDERHELSVSLSGEVQREVIEAMLAQDHGIAVAFRATTTICVERPAGTGAAVEELGEAANPFLATVGLRVEPAPPDTGVTFQMEAELRTIPLYVYRTVDAFGDAIERTVRDALRQGLSGWEVIDCAVTLTRSGYLAPGSSSGDFRKLTPLVLMAALRRAGTRVCEPIHRFRMDGPWQALGPTLRVLAQLEGTPRSTAMAEPSFVLEGDIPAARVQELRHRVPALTGGEGGLETTFDSYRPVVGRGPTRRRTGLDPTNRDAYFLQLSRRT